MTKLLLLYEIKILIQIPVCLKPNCSLYIAGEVMCVSEESLTLWLVVHGSKTLSAMVITFFYFDGFPCSIK